MPTERRQRITDIFELAVRMRPEDRDAFVERECHGDGGVLRDVKSRLSQYRPVEPQHSPALAKQHIGKYEIKGRIGSGGFGQVYSALDPTVGRIVAIKVLNAPGESDMVRRFRVEAKTAANLQHKNIVTVHEFGEEDGVPYLVMEYLDGTTLHELISRNSLSLLEKVEIMSEVAEGLHYAQERGVTHRDVKPANIMRLADGSVKIMDFGIARMATETSARLTQTGFLVGSVMYMAPEQFNGTSDALSDVFSYGVTLYELFTGRNPFSSTDPAVVMYRIINTDPPPVRSVAPDCPETLDRIVRGAMTRAREARYSSMSDVATDVRPLLLDLRRDQGGRLYAEAEQLLAADQLDAAKSAVRKVLELDPVHAGARRLRSEIEEALHRRDATVRAMSLIERAEEELRKRQNEEAASILNVVRRLGLSDPQIQLRLEKADARIEQARRCEKLLDVAQDDLRNHNLTEAFRAVSKALASDPENIAGKNLLHEIRDRMTSREAERRLQDEIARAEGLLLIGETDEALASVKEIERHNPRCAEASALRARAEAQKAGEGRARRLAAGVGEGKALLRNREFEPAISAIDALPIEFADSTELQALRKHAWERLAAMRRLEQIANLRSEATAWIERREFDAALHALKAGVEKLGDDGDLTQLLQRAVAGKATQEQDRALSRIAEETERLRRAGKLDEAVRVVEQAIQTWGGGPSLSGLLQQLLSEKKERDRRRAIDDIARQAAALLQQKQADNALAALRKCIERYGDDPEIQNLVNLAESQLRDRRRSARLKGILEEIGMLVTAKRLPEALQRVDEGLLAFPKEPSLLLKRESLLASLSAEHEARTLQNRGRVDEAPRVEQAAAETAPLWSVRLVNVGEALRRVPLALWVTGGVLAVFGILFWVLQPGPLPNPAQSPATSLADSALRVEKPIGPDSVTVGHYFSQTLRASGNSGPISWDVTEGALPRGLSLDSKSGLIVGTPTTAGQFTFIARV